MKAGLILGFLPACAAAADPLADRRVQCLDWMMSGYPSGLEESACNAQFALPSPFLFRCARAQRAGYASLTERRACGDYLARMARDTAQGCMRAP